MISLGLQTYIDGETCQDDLYLHMGLWFTPFPMAVLLATKHLWLLSTPNMGSANEGLNF
jgi:hypothetical protein